MTDDQAIIDDIRVQFAAKAWETALKGVRFLTPIQMARGFLAMHDAVKRFETEATAQAPNVGPPVPPRPCLCPDCGHSAIQFLVGRGAFCLGCGRQTDAISGGPWKTKSVIHIPADQLPHIDPGNLTKLAVGDAMSGRNGPITVDPQVPSDLRAAILSSLGEEVP